MSGGGRRKTLGPGDRAPVFSLPALEGGSVALKPMLDAGPVALAFFKVSCPTCQFTFPYLERLHRQAAASARPGVPALVGISQDEPGSTRVFVAEFGVSFPALLDSESGGYAVSNAFGITYVPTLFLVGADGRIESVSTGFQKADIEALGARMGAAPFTGEDRVPSSKAG